MVRVLEALDFLALPHVLLDVRSPGEHAHGHVPGAINFPLFDDAERARVGTLYKQVGRDAAVLEGLRIVGPRMAELVERARSLSANGPVRVYCWRGGERSGSMAWLLDKAGLPGVFVLRGGYKAFRRHVLGSFPGPASLRVLGGCTGSGKTETLGLLKDAGAQVVDLEALARHKGSAFGGLGEAPQPTTEHFENRLWAALQALNTAEPVWVEDESLMIGRVKLPPAFYAALRSAPLWFVDMPLDDRLGRLVADYGHFPQEALAASVERIGKRLGPQHCKAALEALSVGDLHAVARITLSYYDRAYRKGMAARDQARVQHVPARAHDLRDLVYRLLANTPPADHG
jgi:tRNA 2-selenouridine synthase